MTRVLLIGDDDETAEEVLGYFRSRAYDVDRAATGPDGLLQAVTGVADAIVLDRMLPDLDGLSILSSMRQDGVTIPTIVVSAVGEVHDRIQGLRAGEYDYLVKPFALARLAARIEALLRRPVIGPETALRVGPLLLDFVARSARRGARELELLPREFRLLEYTARRAGQTVTGRMLFEDVWRYRFTPAPISLTSTWGDFAVS